MATEVEMSAETAIVERHQGWSLKGQRVPKEMGLLLVLTSQTFSAGGTDEEPPHQNEGHKRACLKTF